MTQVEMPRANPAGSPNIDLRAKKLYYLLEQKSYDNLNKIKLKSAL
jgi:hypothetical protein